MNGGTARGGAYGVTFDALVKLNTVKSTDNKSNLLCYVYELAQKKYPEVIDLGESLNAVSAASRINLPVVAASVKSLNKELAAITKMIKQLNNKANDQDSSSDSPGDQFVKTMEPFKNFVQKVSHTKHVHFCVVV